MKSRSHCQHRWGVELAQILLLVMAAAIVVRANTAPHDAGVSVPAYTKAESLLRFPLSPPCPAMTIVEGPWFSGGDSVSGKNDQHAGEAGISGGNRQAKHGWNNTWNAIPRSTTRWLIAQPADAAPLIQHCHAG